jgi:putative colanic acid biosynthesis glycosyltransferase WcaI
VSTVENDVTVQRHWLRVRPNESFTDKALYELTASTFALPHVIREMRRADVVLCVVPTLLSAAYAAAIVRTPRLVFWVQDLVVAAARSVKGAPGTDSVLSLAGHIERWAMNRADHIVVCSPGFASYLEERRVRKTPVELIYNWVDANWIRPVCSRPGSTTRFLYAGNIGYTQGFETLIDAVQAVAVPVQLDIVGAGNATAHLRRLVADVPNVHVRPPVARDAFPGLLATADVHVVLQRRISAGANLPSKIATYMASGRPIVASIDPTTPAAVLLRESGGALVVEPESPKELANAMTRLANDAELRKSLGARARMFAEARLAKDAALERLEAVLVG